MYQTQISMVKMKFILKIKSSLQMEHWEHPNALKIWELFAVFFLFSILIFQMWKLGLQEFVQWYNKILILNNALPSLKNYPSYFSYRPTGPIFFLLILWLAMSKLVLFPRQNWFCVGENQNCPGQNNSCPEQRKFVRS